MFQREFRSVVLSSFVAVVLTSGVAGCAGREHSSTELGATAGGVIGAGLGVLIGSQSGDAGAGLAIGGLAGAGAGAMIGRSIDRVDTAQKNNQEVLARQQASLEAQRRELEELKRSGDLSASSASARGSNSWKESSSGLTRGSYGSASSSDVTYATPEMISQARARLRDSQRTIWSSNPVASSEASARNDGADESTTKLQDVAVATEPESFSAKVKETIDASQEITSPLEIAPVLPDVESSSESNDELARKVQDPIQGGEAAVHTTIATNAATSAGEGKDCARASDELAEARRKEESAERLFHLRRADRLCPDRVDVAIELGRVYGKLGRKEDATFELNRALKLDPNAASAQAELDRLSND